VRGGYPATARFPDGWVLDDDVPDNCSQSCMSLYLPNETAEYPSPFGLPPLGRHPGYARPRPARRSGQIDPHPFSTSRFARSGLFARVASPAGLILAKWLSPSRASLMGERRLCKHPSHLSGAATHPTNPEPARDSAFPSQTAENDYIRCFRPATLSAVARGPSDVWLASKTPIIGPTRGSSSGIGTGDSPGFGITTEPPLRTSQFWHERRVSKVGRKERIEARGWRKIGPFLWWLADRAATCWSV
jgi:hypothetical protein